MPRTRRNMGRAPSEWYDTGKGRKLGIVVPVHPDGTVKHVIHKRGGAVRRSPVHALDAANKPLCMKGQRLKNSVVASEASAVSCTRCNKILNMGMLVQRTRKSGEGTRMVMRGGYKPKGEYRPVAGSKYARRYGKKKVRTVANGVRRNRRTGRFVRSR